MSSLCLTTPYIAVPCVFLASYNFKAFDRMVSRGHTVLKAYFSLRVLSPSSVSSVWSSSQNDPSGWIQKPRLRAELKVSGAETMVGCFLRVPVRCYAYDWSLWVHLAGEAPTNQPLCNPQFVNVYLLAFQMWPNVTWSAWWGKTFVSLGTYIRMYEECFVPSLLSCTYTTEILSLFDLQIQTQNTV